MGREHGFYKSAAKGAIAASTGPCSFIGATIYASAACTITIADSGAVLAGPIVMSALEHVQIMPCRPIACTAGLSLTNSGGGYSTIFYGVK